MKRQIFYSVLLLLCCGSVSSLAQVSFTEAPKTNQLYPRNVGTNLATVQISGQVTDNQIDTLVVRHFRDGVKQDTLLIEIGGNKNFQYTTSIAAAKQAHRFTVVTVSEGAETTVLDVSNVVAGDVYLVQGQSNAVAKQWQGSAAENESPWIRSFGSPDYMPSAVSSDTDWHIANGDTEYLPGSVGQWAIRMARKILDSSLGGVPIALLNGAEGGKPISHFLRSGDPLDLNTNYGRLFWRATQAGVADKVRAVFWYQGEADGTTDQNTSPTVYRDRFASLRDAWKQNFPGLAKIYVFQIRGGDPTGTRLACGSPGPELLDMMRQFDDLYPDVEVMSTTGLDGHLLENNGLYCHWSYEQGYKILGDRIFALVYRDLYGSSTTQGINPPNPQQAYYSRASRKEVTIVMRDSETLQYSVGAHQDFRMSDGTNITGGSVSGNQVILTLAAGAAADARIAYFPQPGVRPWVKNANNIGLLAFANLSIGTRTDLPPDPPELVAPADGAVDLASPVTLDWNASLSATSYDVEVATDDSFTNKVLTAATSATQQTFTPEKSGSFFWRVRAKNVNGMSAWSVARFSVLFPPTAPVLESPANGAVDLLPAPELTWTEGTDARTYDVQVSTTEAFSTLVEEKLNLTGTTYQVQSPLPTGEYFWRVRSRNPNGESGWTAPWHFSVLAAPGAPVLTSPENEAADQPPVLTLVWQPTADAVRYQVQVAAVANFSEVLIDDPEVEETSLEIGPLETGPYFWRVRGLNPNGESEWSSPFSFAVLALPAQVTLGVPSDLVTNLPDSVRFTWSAVADAATYHLQIGTSGNFLTSVYDNNQLTDTTQVVRFSSGTFYWHVRAMNVNGSSPWSATRRFSVLARPNAPVLVYPENLAWNLPTSFELRWNALPDATLYDVQLALDDGFNDIVAEGIDETTLKLLVGPLDPGDYYWRARGKNNSGIGDWSEAYSFSIVTAPDAPTLLTPEDGEAGVVTEPSLSWEAVVNAATYQLSVSRNAQFTSIVFTGLNLETTSQTVGPLDIGTTYYWRVQARNAIGASSWSPVYSFTVRNTTALEQDGSDIPSAFALKPSYPNPFNPATTVAFSLPERAFVRVTVHDLRGREVARLVSQDLGAGEYRTTWNATSESSGVYVIRMQAGGFASTQKVVLLK